MTDERHVPDVIDELGALLEVEPSTAFAANVRNAIDRDAPRRFTWRVMAFAGAAVALAGLALSLAIRPHGGTVVPATRVGSVAAAPVLETPSPVVQPPAARPEPARARATRRIQTRVEDVVDLEPIVATVDGHDVIVPANERLALARFASGVRAGHVSVGPRVSAKYDADGLLLPLAPVAMSAIPDPIPGPIDPPATETGPKGPPKEKR